MTAFITSLLAPYWQYVAGGIVALVGLAGVYLKGKSDEKKEAKIDDLTAANEIRKAGADARAGVDPRGVSNDGWRRD